ncbi:hypothetical protein OJ253_2643 [Cryptosporidium canis]|uniref:Uncharacterized protein n=1 Tax=Cryptosporidium canis TaxID=195482 RepID=A0A9D5DJ00_9CRYT|nr:hypothetical protein OJ253_2643 [Cryptosporidium canis]
MVLVGDFNKEIVGLFKSKYPTEKDKLLELNLSSSSKNPSCSYSVSSLFGGCGSKVGNYEESVGCCSGGKAGGGGCCGSGNDNGNGNKLFSLDGSSILKWNVFSAQLETKMDMSGLAILEARTLPYYGLSLSSKYERFSKSSGLGTLEIGGDIQRECFQSRFRVSPSIESLGCVNRLNKENKSSIGMMLSNTVTWRPFSGRNTLSLGGMVSSSNVNLPYSKNSIRVMMGLMLRGPLCMNNSKDLGLSIAGGERRQKRDHCGSRFSLAGIGSMGEGESSAKSRAEAESSANYILSVQTNTNNHNNRISGFTGGLFLNNMFKNSLALGMLVSYNMTVSPNSITSSTGGEKMMTSSNTSTSNNGMGGMAGAGQTEHGPLAKTDFGGISRISERVQYTVGGKISFGSMDGRCRMFGREASSDLSSEEEGMKSTDLRFKVMNNFRMAYSLTYRFTRNVSATFGAQVDPRRWENPDSVKYGFVLDMSA